MTLLPVVLTCPGPHALLARQEELTGAKSKLRPLQAKELVASAAQAQLWKLEGVEEALARCQNPRLLELKENERANARSVIQLARYAEEHIARYAEEQQGVLRIEGKVEALTRLIEASALELEEESAKPSAAKPPAKKDAREYSTSAFREVAQQILREKRLHDATLKTHLDDGPKVSSRETNKRKYICQGALQLLKVLHQEDRAASPSQPPPSTPPIGLVALARFMGKSETLQREAIKLMAREAAKLTSISERRVLAEAVARGETIDTNHGHWAQMKAMIQMVPRKAVVDASVLNERDVQAAAIEMDVRLVPPRGAAGAAAGAGAGALDKSPGAAPAAEGPAADGPANGLAMLPFVTYFMRAPLPYPFVEEFTESVTDGGRGGSSYRSRRYHMPADAHPSGGGSPQAGGGRRASQSSRVGGAAAAAPPPPTAPPPSAPIYRNVLTNEKETQHPLRHVYARLAKRQAKLIFQRKKPDAMSPEVPLARPKPYACIAICMHRPYACIAIRMHSHTHG